jgi:hypothetical protein
MLRDAISGYIESLKKHGEPIPTEDETLVTSLDSSMPRLPAVKPREVIQSLGISANWKPLQRFVPLSSL